MIRMSQLYITRVLYFHSARRLVRGSTISTGSRLRGWSDRAVGATGR